MINIFYTENWNEYELLDVSSGERLERWNDYIIIRPDPQIIWQNNQKNKLWQNPDCKYIRNNKGGGNWEFYKKIPEHWQIKYNNLKFKIKLTGFKHLGLFPEQATNWDWINEKIKNSQRTIKVLNLFAYTGAASLVAAAANAEVIHIDSSKGAVQWAKENMYLSGLQNKKIRFIVDDVIKFVKREIRRGNKYDGIILDPPVFGRGPKGEVWKLEKELFNLLEMLYMLLSNDPLFFLINIYTSGISAISLFNTLQLTINKKNNCKIIIGEVCLKTKTQGLLLPCGIVGRCEYGEY
ncbi:MAG TPA: class I SAM-dependent methyltransferase [bacterium]|nr:class I SAM-dependent methyltransferase [bacterium]HOL48278.1 class I SAM-dependent methyltransferase [bacterium]HPQ18741.1 class I SAM-dependent methyltransferase [bacterium]